MKRSADEVVQGEDLDLLIGSRKSGDAGQSERVKHNILQILDRKYGITESDLISAELEAVPAFPARDLGLDGSMIGAYGHDDRVCAYPALTALLACKTPRHTAVTILADKEEVGSNGNTGMRSAFTQDFIADLAAAFGEEGRHVTPNSRCLSADVIATLDPLYSQVADIRNIAALSHGVVLSKYRGSGGKHETNDASAELMAEVRRLLDDANVLWQIGEVGKVDEGGGRTVAHFVANLNIDTVDLGVPVLSMHSPLEVVSKMDVFMAYRAFSAFFNRSPAGTCI